MAHLCAVDGVAEVVEHAVIHVRDEATLLLLLAHDLDQLLGDVDVGHLVRASDVVNLANLHSSATHTPQKKHVGS